MSNIIPIVSSSPPPLDDVGTGWDDDNDDDDDEFGNFTSAPNVSPTAIASLSSFDVNWSKSDLSLPNDNIHNEKTGESKSDEDIRQQGTKASLDKTTASIPSKSAFNEWVNNNSERTNSGEGEEFPDFAQFNGDTDVDNHPVKVDCVTSSAEINEHSDADIDTDVCKEGNISNKHQSSDSISTDHDSFSFGVSKNNESVYSISSTIDSGVFSTDLSPSSHGTLTSDLYQSTDASSLEKPVAIVKTINDSPSGNPSNHDSKSLEEYNSDFLHSSLDENASPKLSHVDESEDWSDFNTALGNGTECADENDTNSVNSECQKNCKLSETAESPTHSIAITNVNEFEDFTNTASEMRSVFNSSSVPSEHAPGDHSDLLASSNPEEEKSADQGHNVISFLSDTSVETQSDYTNKLNVLSVNVDEMNIELVSDTNVMSHENDSDWGDFNNADCKDEGEDLDSSKAQEKSQCDEEDLVLDKESFHHISDLQNTVLKKEDDLDKMSENDELVVSEDPRIKNEFSDKNVSSIDDLSSITPNTTEDNNASCCAENVESKDNNLEDEEDKEFGLFVSLPNEEVPPITFRTSVCEAEEADGDFGFDELKPPPFNEDDDDFGAFGEATLENDGEFDSAAQPINDVSRLDDGKDNDFGEFGTADQNIEGDASWADFGEAAPLSLEKEPSGSGDADIKSYSMPPPKSAEQNQSKVQKLERAVVSCFPDTIELAPGHKVSNDGSHKNSLTDATNTAPDQSDNSTPLEIVVELGLTNPLEVKQQTWTVVQHPAKKDPKVRLWNNLKDVDSTHALVYSWPTSHCSQQVYGTLHIDTQNVLFSQKKQAVPFFASGLILEPIRGGENKIHKHVQSPATLLDTNRLEQHQTMSTVQDIPPVDFDWSSSGLTNPLTANTLDLDFLVVQGSDSYEKASVFKADCQESTRSSLQPLEDILKKSTPTVKLATHEVLSPEALRILEKMPDLSFMQSRVLMFPVKQ